MARQRAETIKPGGGEAFVYHETVWSNIRQAASISDDFVNSGWSMADLSAGGGKGGTLMAKVGTQYIVKELSEGDHKALLECTESYEKHLKGGDTLITPIYLHFEDEKSKRKFFVMQNCLGGCPEPTDMYDLKGCADDKSIRLEGVAIKTAHKRIWNVGMWCGQGSWTDDRKIYYKGKKHAGKVDFAVSAAHKKYLDGAIRRDCDWLAQNRLMDYSLLVAVKRGPAGTTDPSSPGAFVRRRPEGDEEAVFIGIIDILQKWTGGKKVARVLKSAECNKATVPPRDYGNRFAKHFALHIVDTVEDSAVVAKANGATVAPPAGQTAVRTDAETSVGKANVFELSLPIESTNHLREMQEKAAAKLQQQNIAKDRIDGDPKVTYVASNGKITKVDGPESMEALEFPGQMNFVFTLKKAENLRELTFAVSSRDDLKIRRGQVDQKMLQEGLNKDQVEGEPTVTYIAGDGKRTPLAGPEDLENVELPGQMTFAFMMKQGDARIDSASL